MVEATETAMENIDNSNYSKPEGDDVQTSVESMLDGKITIDDNNLIYSLADDGRVHYDLALGPMLRRILEDPKCTRESRERVSAILDDYANQYRPLPMALKFHQSTARYRWCLGGNRSSKSHSVAQEVYWYSTGTHPWKNITVPNTGWYCTLTWEMVGSILWDKMERLLTPLLQRNEARVIWHNRNRGIPEVVFLKVPGGESRIIFKAYEQGADAFQGTERRYIGNDEQFSQGIYMEQVTRIGAKDPLDFFAALTPIKPQSWLESGLSDPPDNWDVFEYPLDDNRLSAGGFISDEEIDALIDEWPEEIQPTRRFGKWASFLGAVYKTFNRKFHVVTEDRDAEFFGRGSPRPTIYHRVFYSIDWGSNNPFVILWGVRVPHMDDAWFIFDEYYWDNRAKGQRLLSEHASTFHDKNKRWNAVLGAGWADHDAQDRFEFSKLGIPTGPAVKDDVRAGIETVQRYLKLRRTSLGKKRPRLFISQRCVHTIREISGYMWPDGTDTKDPADLPVKKDDHTCDALRYLIHSEETRHKGNKKIPNNSGKTLRRQF